MPMDREGQRMRRRAIVAILEREEIASQQELVDRLVAAGILATQSSVSRDLKDLGVAWIGGRYTLSPAEAAERGPGFGQVRHFLRRVRTAGPHLAVVSTEVGTAQTVALALDHAGWPEVVGTVAGDDTIFVATASPDDQKRLLERLEQVPQER